MTPQEQRNEQLAQTIVKNLKRRHMEGFYCATAEEAVKKVSELIEDGSSVTWGGTMRNHWDGSTDHFSHSQHHSRGDVQLTA